MHHRFDRVPHENGWVIHHCVVNAFGEVFLQFFHRVTDILGKLDGIGSRQLKDRHGNGSLVIEQRAQRVARRAQFDAGDVPEQDLFAIRTGLDDDLTEFLLRNQPALGVDLQLEVDRPADGLLANGAGGNLDVLFADGVDHVAGGQVPGGNLVRVEPDPHRVITRAEELDVARARDAGQGVLDLEGGVVSQIDLVVAAIGGEQMNHHGQVGRLLGGRDAQLSDFFGQLGQRLRDAVLHLHLGFVNVGSQLERDGQRHHAVRGRL